MVKSPVNEGQKIVLICVLFKSLFCHFLRNNFASDNVKFLIGKVPLFGICLGHQILSLALGASTSKLRFGHHGGNQPVINLESQKVEITSQNHGFTVDPIPINSDYSTTLINLNDNTVEGILLRT